MAENVETSGELETPETPATGAEGVTPPAGGDLKVALQQERAKTKELKERVDKLAPLATEYEAILPLLPALLAQQKAAQAQAEQEEEDEEALAVAQDFGFEDENGKPDVAKARKVLDRINQTTGRAVNKATAPANQVTAQMAAAQVKDRAYKATGEDGKLYAKREFIDQVFSQIPAEALTNPDNAIAALVMARGLGGPGDEPSSEPVFSESVRRQPKQKVLSDLDKHIVKMRGKSEKDWAERQDDPETTGWDLE